MRKALFVCLLAGLLGIVPFASSQNPDVLHNFGGIAEADGADPVADLAYYAPAQMLYGVTNNGGFATTDCPKGCGTVFGIGAISGSTPYGVVYSFMGGTADGAHPEAGLVIDGSGNMYGTTYDGGASNDGTVFELTPSGSGFLEHVIFSFSGSNGSHPLARLLLDSSGNLYGTTYSGGAHNYGTFFELTPPSGSGLWTESFLLSFTGKTGANPGAAPKAGVVFGSSQNVLWGTTYRGGTPATGTPNLGTVFKLTKSGTSWSESFVFPFGGPDGSNPAAAVTLDSAGNVYGTTQFGGMPAGGDPGCAFATAGCGVIFQLQPSGVNNYIDTTLYSFTGLADGAEPLDDLTIESDGSGIDLYGTASEAGTVGGSCGTLGCGTVFQLCSMNSGTCGGSLSWNLDTLFDFNKTDGSKPAAGLTVVPGLPSGQLSEVLSKVPPPKNKGCTSTCFGTASAGGSKSDGTLYSN